MDRQEMVIERIKELCRNNGTSISQLEKELGFSNGSLVKSKAFSSERIYAIAQKFNVSMEFLMDGKKDISFNEESAILLAKMAKDPLFFDAIKKFYKLDNSKKRHVTELIYLLS